MEAVIRKASLKDNLSIHRVLNLAHKKNTRMGFRFPATRLSLKQLTNKMKKDRYYVLTKKGRIIGTVAVKKRKHNWEIGSLSIIPKYQRQGFGNRLLRFAERKAKKRGAKRVFLFTLKNHPSLPSYYRHQGYHTVKRVQVYCRKWICLKKIL